GAASEELAVADRGFERGRGPQFERLGRLHVVVPVHEHGRRAGGRLAPLGEHHGMAGSGNRLRREADVHELLVQPGRGAERVGVVLRARTDAGNPEELEQLVEYSRVVLREPCIEIGGNLGSGHGHWVQGNGCARSGHSPFHRERNQSRLRATNESPRISATLSPESMWKQHASFRISRGSPFSSSSTRIIPVPGPACSSNVVHRSYWFARPRRLSEYTRGCDFRWYASSLASW